MHFSHRAGIYLSLFATIFLTAVQGQTSPSREDANPMQTQVKPPAKDKFLVYLLMGQSNMAGRGSITSEDQEASPRILSMKPDGQWVQAKDPLHQQVGRTKPGIGPGMSFANQMLKADPSVTIGLVPCAVGGTQLSRWTKGKGGDLYERAVESAKLAARTGTISGILWHQGESDAGKQSLADSYETRLAGMIKNLREDLGQPDLPVVVGQLGEFLNADTKQPGLGTVRAALKNLPNIVPHTGYADSAGLKDKGDKLHFNADAQKEMGVRYAKAMQELKKH